MYVAILGRQPQLGIAELERLFRDVTWFSSETACIATETPIDVTQLGGSQKVGRIVATLPFDNWNAVSKKVVQAYSDAWAGHEHKITLGISAYGFSVSPREVQKTGLVLKNKLKGKASLRLLPNQDAALSTATSHHNKLGLSEKKVELLIVRGSGGKAIIAESIGAQNITAYAKRDQGRPKRDAFVGMLPPKLAQIMINLAAGDRKSGTLLDPFCGTGVILQEAALRGFTPYGTDLSPKMVDFSRQNMAWLARTHGTVETVRIEQGDAMDMQWQQPIDIVACESYLGQPFSAPPSPSKLREVRGNCNHIISTFLKNISTQLRPGTPLCVAVPAWRGTDGSFTHLPFIQDVRSLGFTPISLSTVSSNELLYYRDDQVVARELLILQKT